MVRITRQVSDNQIVLIVEGRLLGEWVEELQRCWREAVGAGQQICVDLRKVSFVDTAGRQLLSRMSAAGVELAASGPMMTEVVRECVVNGAPYRLS